jgi:hypothetical protein
VLQGLGIEDYSLETTERTGSRVEIAFIIAPGISIVVFHFMRMAENDHVVFSVEPDRVAKVLVGIVIPMPLETLVVFNIAVVKRLYERYACNAF